MGAVEGEGAQLWGSGLTDPTPTLERALLRSVRDLPLQSLSAFLPCGPFLTTATGTARSGTIV